MNAQNAHAPEVGVLGPGFGYSVNILASEDGFVGIDVAIQ